jgi:3-oxoacyl-[acyl-carrier-protein] synthase III
MGNIIVGTGSYVPDEIITNEDLYKYVDLSDFDEIRAKCTYPEWVEQVMGFKLRRRAANNQATSDLAVKAAQKAIESAGIKASDIDLIIVSTATPDKFSPHTAAIVQSKLGISGSCYASDRLSACPGFVWALTDTDAQLKANPHYKYALVISADKMSRIVDPRNKITMATFGDGAGAVVIRRFENELNMYGVMRGYNMTDGGKGEFLDIPAGGSSLPINLENIDEIFKKGYYALQMNAQGIKAFAINKLAEATRFVLRKEQVPISAIDYFLPHQASGQFIQKGANDIGIPLSKTLTNYQKYGNMSQASIPVLLDEYSRKNTFKNGDLLVLTGMGGGLGWGSVIYRWFDYSQMPKNILIVDDEEGAAEALSDMLSSIFDFDNNFQTQVSTTYVTSGEKALDLLETSPGLYDIAIFDQRMPGISGLETIDKAKQVHPDLICTILTAYSDPNDLTAMINARSIAAIMHKPFISIGIGLDEYVKEENYLKLKTIIEKPYLFF